MTRLLNSTLRELGANDNEDVGDDGKIDDKNLSKMLKNAKS